MATKLKTLVSRELESDAWNRKRLVGLNGKDSARNLVVTLEPCGLISFRLKGLQSSYEVDIERVFAMAVRDTALKAVQDARREKEIERGL